MQCTITKFAVTAYWRGAGLPLTVARTGWRNRLLGTSWNSVWTNAKSTNPGDSRGWEQLCKEGAETRAQLPVYHIPAVPGQWDHSPYIHQGTGWSPLFWALRSHDTASGSGHHCTGMNWGEFSRGQTLVVPGAVTPWDDIRRGWLSLETDSSRGSGQQERAKETRGFSWTKQERSEIGPEETDAQAGCASSVLGGFPALREHSPEELISVLSLLQQGQQGHLVRPPNQVVLQFSMNCTSFLNVTKQINRPASPYQQ